MNKYNVEVSWTMQGSLTIEAGSRERAEEIAEDKYIDAYNGSYLDDSFTVDKIEIQGMFLTEEELNSLIDGNSDIFTVVVTQNEPEKHSRSTVTTIFKNKNGDLFSVSYSQSWQDGIADYSIAHLNIIKWFRLKKQ